MKKKIFLTKVINAGVGCMILAVAAVSVTGCHKKEGQPAIVEYSDVMGTAEGIADFQSADTPDINIKDIQSYLGQEIDYSSEIDIKNVDNFEDFQMWVDATGVDIYTAGNYTATYQFVFGGKTLEKTIGVTILEKEESAGDNSLADNSQGTGSNSSDKNFQNGNSSSANEGGNNSGEDVANGGSSGEGSQGGNAGNNSNGGSSGEGSQGGNAGNNSNGGSSGGDSQGGNAGNSSNGGSSSGGSQGGNIGNNSNGGSQGGNTGNSSNGGSQGGNTGNSSNGGSQGGNTGNSSNGNASSETREIITSSQSGTKKASTIGYANIELLSGKYVKLKCTDARYIISTRTDESQTIKNDKTYHTSKLVVTFNTGEERVLETVEKAVN